MHCSHRRGGNANRSSDLGIGGGTIAFGITDSVEGAQDIYYGSMGDIDSISINQLKDVIFQGNEDAYYMAENIFAFAASAFIPISQASVAGNLTFRSGSTIVAKEGISMAAGELASAATMNVTGNQTASMLAGMLAGGVTAQGLNGLDGKFNISGWNNGGKYSAFGEMSEAEGIRYRDWNYEKIYEISIHNPNSDSMILGKYFDGTIESGSYVARAEVSDNTYFSLGTQWDDISGAYGLTDKDMFNLFNKRALDDAVAQGKIIRFSQNPMEWSGTALGDEWNYLQSKHGYTRLKQIGDYWYAK